MPTFGFGWWIKIARCLVGMQHQVEWIPTHGRHEEWKGAWGYRLDTLRKLNDRADEAAKEGKDMVKAHFHGRPREKEIERAESWARVMLRRQHEGALAVIASDGQLAVHYERSVKPIRDEPTEGSGGAGASARDGES